MSGAERQDIAWQAAELTDAYLEGVRGAIPLAVEQVDIILRLAHAAQPEAGTILDLGCGDGILGHALLNAYPNHNIVAFFADFSPPMLEAARARLNGYPAHFIEVDYAYPGWEKALKKPCIEITAGFDIIVSGFSIHHQPDRRKREVYQEIFDLLSPGGIFLNLEHVASRSRWGEEQFEAYFIDALHRYHAPLGKTREQVAADFYHRPDKVANILATADEQCRWLRDIGFENVDCFLKIFELAIFGGIKPDFHRDTAI